MPIAFKPVVAPAVLSLALLAAATLPTHRAGADPARPAFDILVSQGLPPEVYSGSGFYEEFLPALAFDGDEYYWRKYWNAGNFAPQWVEVDLGRTEAITRIRLVVAMLPNGDTTHEVWVSDRPIRTETAGATKLHTFEGPTMDRQVLEFRMEAPRAARYVQIRTTASPSWVAWMEVQVYAAPPS